MVRFHGQQYDAFRQEVSMLIPVPTRRERVRTDGAL